MVVRGNLPFLLVLISLVTLGNSFQFGNRLISFPGLQVLKSLSHGKAFKVISGITNFDRSNVEKVVQAAEEGGATFVDIACDSELVKLAKSICRNTAVCVSSIYPEQFVSAVEAGADVVELGNFDGFYEKGMKFNAQNVIEMTKQTRSLLPYTLLSVTVPHTLPLDEQILLAKALEELGVDIIQTEGKTGADISETMGIETLIKQAAPAIASAHALSRSVKKIPILCSSGITDITAPMALAAGAKGVGIGSMINKLKTKEEMVQAVRKVIHAMNGIDLLRSQRERNEEDYYLPENLQNSSPLESLTFL
jgi:thiamine monophosphate synthase